MILSTMILVSSVALALFYFQATCENILNREFDGVRLKSVANAVRLEFLFVRNEMEDAKGRPIDYRWVSMALKCDHLALTYLMRNTGTYSRWERLLILHFRSFLGGLSPALIEAEREAVHFEADYNPESFHQHRGRADGCNAVEPSDGLGHAGSWI